MALIRTKPPKRRRNVAHLWADKRVLRFIRHRFDNDGNHGKHLLLVYLALCQIDSDFGEGIEIKGFTKTVATYAHLSREVVTTYLKAFQKAGISDYPQSQEETPSGPRFGAKTLELYEWIEKDEDRMESIIRKVLRLRVEAQADIGSVAPSPVCGSTSSYKNPSKEGSLDKNLSKERSDVIARETQETRIFNLWNKLSKESGIQSAKGLSPIRKKRIRAHIQRYGFSQVKLAVKKVHRSDFCKGFHNGTWQASFDWFIKPETENSKKSSPIVLALEGQYDNRKSKGGDRIAGRKVISRSGSEVILENGEPIYTDSWGVLFDENPHTGEKFKEGRLWVRGNEYVFCPAYPEPLKGRMHAQARPVDPSLLKSIEEFL